MPVARRLRSCARLLRLLPAAFAIALAMGGVATASTPDDHAVACKCGMNCRPGACCCGPKRSTPRREPQPEPQRPATDDTPDESCGPSGPCLGAMPCGGDAAAPVKTATVGAGEAWLRAGTRHEGSPGEHPPPPSSDRPHPADDSRLDRPPKADPTA